MSQAVAIVVTYNSEPFIGRCLDSCLERGVRAVVVDNASTDGNVREVRQRPGAALLENPVNRGFAAAVNQGVAATHEEFILLLNPDAELLSGVEALVEACRQPGVGAAGGKLVDSAGRPQRGFSVRSLPTAATLIFESLGLNRVWKTNPVNRRYRCLGLDLDTPADVEQPAGAFLMFRRDAWSQVGGLDEAFTPVWFEDVDFCKRLLDAGYRIRYEPKGVAQHAGARSVALLDQICRQAYWYGSLLMYTQRHLRPAGRRLVALAVLAGLAPRTVMGILHQASLRRVSDYDRVFHLAARCLFGGTARGPAPGARAGRTADIVR